jgi:CRP/FNR family transcriptional regulator, cyclic AMP receptor protein
MHGTEFGGILLRNGWLSQLPDAERQTLVSICRIRRFNAGDPLYNAGDPAGGFHGLAFGVVALVYPDRSADMTLVHLAQPGIWFGEIAMMNNMPRRVSAIARTNCATMYAPLPALRTLLEARPEWWRFIGQISAHNLAFAISGAEDLMLRDNNRRCIATLLRLCGCRAEDPDPMLAGASPVTQDELASMANMSRNKAGEVLRELEERGLISLGYRSVTIRQGATLRAMVDGI